MMNKRNRVLCLCLSFLLMVSLAACNSPTDEQNSAQPTPSTQPTAAPTPTPTPPPIPYTDVAEDSPYCDAVVWAYKNGIASDGETFGPADACTRGQVLTFLWRAMGSPEPWIMENPLDDASPDDWYYKPALWAYQHNITTSATVNPGNPCTSAEALTFLWRAEGKPDKLNTLAASDTYYGQPVAWADKNGLFAGTEFDPAAPCSRADWMAYLYWAVEQWTPSKEERRIQAEYDKILYSSSNGLDYAEYVDVDGDGSVELLTLGNRYNNGGEEIAIAVYADIDGHIEKSCEGIFRVVDEWENTPADTFLTDGGVFSLYSSDGQLYLCQNRSFYHYSRYDDLYDFYKIGKEAFTFCEQRSIWTLLDRETGEEQKGDTGTSRNYTKQKDILLFDDMGPEVLGRGILPDWQEYVREREKYWTAFWEASDPIYAAALSGDFSAFAGNYNSGSFSSYTLNRDGVLAGDYVTNNKPISVSVDGDGSIFCGLQKTMVEEDMMGWEGYSIYPVGVSVDAVSFTYMEGLIGVKDDPSKVRIVYTWPRATQGIYMTKIS